MHLELDLVVDSLWKERKPALEAVCTPGAAILKVRNKDNHGNEDVLVHRAGLKGPSFNPSEKPEAGVP